MGDALLRDIKYFLQTCAAPVQREDKLTVERLMAIIRAQNAEAARLLRLLNPRTQHVNEKDGK
jgi:hypothetical protein